MFFRDIDGYLCLNPHALLLNNLPISLDKLDQYPSEDIDNAVQDTVLRTGRRVLGKIAQYKGTSIVDKYLWRVRPFNYTCRFLADLPCGEMLDPESDYTLCDELKGILMKSTISEEAVMVASLESDDLYHLDTNTLLGEIISTLEQKQVP